MAGVGDCRSARHSVLSGRLAGLPTSFSRNGSLLMPLSFKTVWKASLVLLSRYRFKRTSNFLKSIFAAFAASIQISRLVTMGNQSPEPVDETMSGNRFHCNYKNEIQLAITNQLL